MGEIIHTFSFLVALACSSLLLSRLLQWIAWRCGWANWQLLVCCLLTGMLLGEALGRVGGH